MFYLRYGTQNNITCVLQMWAVVAHCIWNLTQNICFGSLCFLSVSCRRFVMCLVLLALLLAIGWTAFDVTRHTSTGQPIAAIVCSLLTYTFTAQPTHVYSSHIVIVTQ